MGKNKKIIEDIEQELLKKPYYFDLRQEILYQSSNFLWYKWYRRLYGGQWRLLHLVKGTPTIGMFCVWSKMTTSYDGTDCWSGWYKVLETENYPETRVVTKWQLFKEFFKQLFKKYDN